MTVLCDPTTGDALFELAAASPSEAAEAVARARAAQPGWAALGAHGRAARLAVGADRVAADADELTELIVTDVGKPVTEARGEVARAVAILRYAAAQATAPAGELYEDATGAQVRVLRAPHGVALLICPWNFPIAIPTWKLAPALQTGNTVVLKPAPPAQRIAERLAEHLDLGDVLQVVAGEAETATALLDARPDVVSFTGSTATGRAIAEALAGTLIPLQCEMGGKNGVYVSAQADPGQAAQVALAGAMGYAGQKCTATSLLLVHEAAAGAVQAALTERLAALGVGDPHDPDTVVGPLIAAPKRDQVAEQLDAARGRGVDVLGGGAALEREGSFLAPTVVAGGAPEDEVNATELFAPVLAVQPVASLDAALERLRALDYGLISGIVSPVLDEVEAWAAGAPTGMVRVNAPTAGVEPHVPFGGLRASSYGAREQGRAGFEFFAPTRTIYG